MIQVRRFLLNTMRRFSLWQLMALGIVGVATWDGTGYSVKGNSVAKGGSFQFMRESIPFGMHTHGCIMLILAGAVLYTMHDRARAAMWVMWVTFLYSITVICALLYGWHLSGEITWSAPSKWAFVAWAALVLQVKIDELNYGRLSHKNGV